MALLAQPQIPELPPGTTIASLHAAKTALYTTMITGGAVGLRPGVEALLTQARAAGLRLAIATTTSRANVVALLDSTLARAADGWFEVMVCGEDVIAKKPAAEVYLKALSQLNLTAQSCLAIEDSENGFAAASLAGIPTVVTRSLYTARETFDGASVVLDDLMAAADALGPGDSQNLTTPADLLKIITRIHGQTVSPVIKIHD
jgi:HAD superfamily hydrolase (TIGR01509 family)